MKRPLKIGMAVLLTSLLAGCGGGTPSLRQPVERDKVFNSSFEEVWDASVSIIARGGNFINTVDKESGLITFSRAVEGDDAPAYTGGGFGKIFGLGRSDPGTAQMNVLIKEVSNNQAEVFINGSIKVPRVIYNRFGNPVGTVENIVSSNGKIEMEFMGQLAMELGEKGYQWLQEGKDPKEAERADEPMKEAH